MNQQMLICSPNPELICYTKPVINNTTSHIMTSWAHRIYFTKFNEHDSKSGSTVLLKIFTRKFPGGMSYIAMCTTQKDSKCKTERERKGSSHTWYLAYWLDKAKLKCKNLWHFTVCYLWSTHIKLIIFTAVYFQHWLGKQSGCKDTMYYQKYYFCHTLIKWLFSPDKILK